MPLTCTKCSRTNPDEAAYCYFDGEVLAIRNQAAGDRMHTGLRPFPTPLVFPSGETCRNFDQLVRVCQGNWPIAVGFLRQGYLENFLSNLGRADLAKAARAAAQVADGDRGLDFLLAKIPSQIFKPARLSAANREINLGRIPVGANRRLEVNLTNQGMGLLYGTMTCDCLWLTLGDAGTASQKIFQFSSELAFPLHVRGQHLRASSKPQEGRLQIESNNGSATVVVRIEVPVKPFTRGVLAGATSPRQIVEKTKAAPDGAATLFENGSVAGWYQQNGWSYPVQAPAASGIDAVLQFFKALGLTDESSDAPPAIPVPGPPDPAAPIAKRIIPFPFGVLAGALTRANWCRRHGQRPPRPPPSSRTGPWPPGINRMNGPILSRGQRRPGWMACASFSGRWVSMTSWPARPALGRRRPKPALGRRRPRSPSRFSPFRKGSWQVPRHRGN